MWSQDSHCQTYREGRTTDVEQGSDLFFKQQEASGPRWPSLCLSLCLPWVTACPMCWWLCLCAVEELSQCYTSPHLQGWQIRRVPRMTARVGAGPEVFRLWAQTEITYRSGQQAAPETRVHRSVTTNRILLSQSLHLSFLASRTQMVSLRRSWLSHTGVTSFWLQVSVNETWENQTRHHVDILFNNQARYKAYMGVRTRLTNAPRHVGHYSLTITENYS